MGYLDFERDRELDIIFLGRIAVDFNPAYSEKVKEGFKPLREVHYFEMFVGGSPANSACGVRRHGLKAGFFARISEDQLGDFVLHFFRERGIDVSHIRRCKNGENIGLTFTEMLSSRESRILMYRNRAADLQLDVSDIDEDYLKKAKAILISGTALSESPSREAALKAVMLARRNRVKVFFDIDYRAYNWKNRDEISIYYAAVAKEADLIIGSREEFDLTERLIREGMTDRESAAYWMRHNAKIVVIKHGMEGSSAYTDDGRSYSVKPFPVEARKGFGGGDGYNAAFLSSLFKGREIMDCLEYGSAEAAMMVRSNNCSLDLPDEEELERFMKEEKAVYGERIARGEDNG